MHVIAIANEKGGTAKTTTAVNLSAALGELNQKVLLVDLDGQAASSRWLGVEEDTRLADAIVRGGGLEPIADLLPGVSLAPSSGKLDSIAHDLRPTQGGQLRRVLTEVADSYNYVLIDCPPSLGNRLIGNALLASTHAIVPVETSILALDGLKILLMTLEDIREGFGHEIILGGVVACRFDARTRLSRLVLEELRRALPGKVFQTVIRENVRMRECPASGQSILTFAPDSHGTEDYRALAKEVLAHPILGPDAEGRVSEAKGGDAFEQHRFLRNDLREDAAAKVRECVQSASWGKAPTRETTGTPDAERADVAAEPTPPEVPEQEKPGETVHDPSTSEMAPDEAQIQEQPQASEDVIIEETAAVDQSGARDSGRQEMTSWLDSLAAAETRLATEEEEKEVVLTSPDETAEVEASAEASAPSSTEPTPADQPPETAASPWSRSIQEFTQTPEASDTTAPSPAQLTEHSHPYEHTDDESAPDAQPLAPAEPAQVAEEGEPDRYSEEQSGEKQADYPALRAYLSKMAKISGFTRGKDGSKDKKEDEDEAHRSEEQPSETVAGSN